MGDHPPDRGAERQREALLRCCDTFERRETRLNTSALPLVISDLGFVPFAWGDERDPMGWARPECADAMRAAGILRDPIGPFEPYRMETQHVDGVPVGSRLQDLARHWHRTGLLPGWRNETFDIYSPGHPQPRFALERVAARHLGLWTEAVHLNVVRRDGSAMWLARRAAHKDTDPGMLDNLVAGGVPRGESPWQTLCRESWEEAGILLGACEESGHAGGGTGAPIAQSGSRARNHSPQSVSGERSIAQPAYQPRALRTVQILALEGTPRHRYLRRERLYAFELEVDEGFRPVNNDGEVSEHLLVSRTALDAAIAQGLLTKDAACVAGLWRAQEEGGSRAMLGV
jgi:8-oxo-dGTP pyrophosphatase MutT (NUDIX family)